MKKNELLNTFQQGINRVLDQSGAPYGVRFNQLLSEEEVVTDQPDTAFIDSATVRLIASYLCPGNARYTNHTIKKTVWDGDTINEVIRCDWCDQPASLTRVSRKS